MIQVSFSVGPNFVNGDSIPCLIKNLYQRKQELSTEEGIQCVLLKKYGIGGTTNKGNEVIASAAISVMIEVKTRLRVRNRCC